MDQNRFDAITKLFGDRSLSRRQAMMKGGAALAAGALAGVAGPSRAQDATPEAAPAGSGKHTVMMFVQSFRRGRILRTAGHEDRYTLTLEQGLGHTIFFSDRPDRIVGSTPTPQFLDGLGFLDDNPPNAALIIETASGETDIAVVEIFNPVFNPESPGVTYEVEVLANWQRSLETGLVEAPTHLADLAELAPEFGLAHLFIDDCPDYKMFCYYGNPGDRKFIGSLGPQDHCYSVTQGMCLPCDTGGKIWQHEIMSRWDAKCNAALPACQGNCRAVAQ